MKRKCGQHKDFVNFLQIYCSYLLKDDYRLTEKESEQLKQLGIKFFKVAAPYTCMSCGNKSGLSFIEKKHLCTNPMFDKSGIPILSRVIEICDEKGLNFELIKKSVIINKAHTCAK